MRVAVASHNLRSVAHAIAFNRLLRRRGRDLELQVLRGLGDELQDALAARGFRVRTYCPVGDLVAGMAYLVRRLLENTSNESFLSEQARGAPLSSCCRALSAELRERATSAQLREPNLTVLPPFANEPALELRRSACARCSLTHWAGRRRAAATSRCGSARTAPRGEELVSTDPGEPRRSSLTAPRERPRSTRRSRPPAAGRPLGGAPASRARGAFAAAAWMRERRLELAALEVRECAKPWHEADADVCEAIDFLEYYARGAIELARAAALLQVPGEHNELRYVPRGVAAVISPWNFPLAIPCGMTAAALVTGNAVVLKPAEQSPACALPLVRALRAGGVPAWRWRCSPARARSVPRSCAIPRWRRSPSPARFRSVARSCAPPRRQPGQRTSSGWWPSWAARTA